jgi:RND family efflux transporter MFP subunit
MTRRRAPALALVLAAIAGCAREDGRRKAGEEAPTEVAVVAPARRDVAREIPVPVEVFPWFETDIVAKVTGYVVTVSADRGSTVSEGDLLATIFVPELEAERRQREQDVKVAQADVASAEAEREVQRLIAGRTSALVLERAATQQEADIQTAKLDVVVASVARAKARVAAAEQALETTRIWLSYALVRAPFAGEVTLRAISPGSLVWANERTLLFHLIDRAVVRATIDVPEASALEVVPGETRVRMRFEELPGEFEGVVARSADALDPKTRTLRVEVDLPNAEAEGRFVPRMYGDAMVVLALHRGALIVPEEAIVRAGDRAGVLVIREGRAKRIEVTLGIETREIAEVVSDLDPLEPVIARARGIREGAAVVAIPGGAAGPGRSSGDGGPADGAGRGGAR